jgi:hypothetical protein
VTTQKHRASFSGGISFVVAAAVAVVGCFGRPSTNVATMTCQQDVDCLSGYSCRVKGVPGGCCKPDDVNCGRLQDGATPTDSTRSNTDSNGDARPGTGGAGGSVNSGGSSGNGGKSTADALVVGTGGGAGGAGTGSGGTSTVDAPLAGAGGTGGAGGTSTSSGGTSTVDAPLGGTGGGGGGGHEAGCSHRNGRHDDLVHGCQVHGR